MLKRTAQKNNTNIIRGEKIAVEISKINSINFFVENTKYMSDFVTVQANKDLLSAIDGKLTHRSYEDKNGEKRYITEVVANDVLLLGK